MYNDKKTNIYVFYKFIASTFQETQTLLSWVGFLWLVFIHYHKDQISDEYFLFLPPLRNQSLIIFRVQYCLCDHVRFIPVIQGLEKHILEETKYVSFSDFTQVQFNVYIYLDAISFKLYT